jgi:hypothetical protein
MPHKVNLTITGDLAAAKLQQLRDATQPVRR